MKKFLLSMVGGFAEIRHLFPRLKLFRVLEVDPYKDENLYTTEDPRLAEILKQGLK